MMQVPSSNQSHTSRRSNASSTASIARWFDGLLDKACCAPGYAAKDIVDDNSIAYSATGTTTTTSQKQWSSRRLMQQRRDDSDIWDSDLFDTAEGKVHWLADLPSYQVNACTTTMTTSPTDSTDSTEVRRTPQKQKQTKKTHKNRPTRFSHLRDNAADLDNTPQSPRSDATATTVLTGSTSCSRSTTPIHNRSPQQHQQEHNLKQQKQFYYNLKQQKKSRDKLSSSTPPAMPIMMPTNNMDSRSHSTGNMRSPEEEWQQVQKQQPERRIPNAKLPQRPRREKENRKSSRKATKENRRPTEQVVIPEDWEHDHGLRRIWSETLPKLPFQTVQPAYGM